MKLRCTSANKGQKAFTAGKVYESVDDAWLKRHGVFGINDDRGELVTVSLWWESPPTFEVYNEKDECGEDVDLDHVDKMEIKYGIGC